MGTNYYSIHIAKIPMDVKINDVDKSKVYGYPNPAFRIQYSGFINGENEQTMSFQNSLVPPTVTCEADEHTPVGAVPIELADGSSANYEFRYEESALSITPRNLKITKMTSVPRIPQNAPLSFQATADESQFEAEGLVTGDHVTLSFDVVYPESLTEGAKTVQIQNVVITDKNEGGNYKLLSAPTSAEGMVDSRQITGIELTAQPKLEYVYGEPLDLSGLRATIHYAGDTAPETGLRYTDLLERQIEILYEKDGKQFPAAQSDHLTVGVHNEAAVRFRAAGQLLGETQPLSVARRELEFRVSADSKAYDGGMNTSGTVRLLNAVEGDDVSAVGQFRFQDPNASNQLKDVEVALSLTGEDADNYTIAATAKAQAQIIRAARTEKVETPTVELDRMTNNLIVT